SNLSLSSQIFKAILIALLVSISLQREYHNGMERWKLNCKLCMGSLRAALEYFHFSEERKQQENVLSYIQMYCSSLDGYEAELCNEMLKIGYFNKGTQELFTKYFNDRDIDAEGMCREKRLRLCPPTDKRSMYDTPEFPLLRLPEQVKRDFNNVVQSMNRPEFD
ncbi:hypothetical protein PENTCL1PPCAC_1848, partial [Pristionchus entomophagus]